MDTLSQYLDEIRASKTGYTQGLSAAMDFTNARGGIALKTEKGKTVLVLDDDSVTCFQPYEDIDLFYNKN